MQALHSAPISHGEKKTTTEKKKQKPGALVISASATVLLHIIDGTCQQGYGRRWHCLFPLLFWKHLQALHSRHITQHYLQLLLMIFCPSHCKSSLVCSTASTRTSVSRGFLGIWLTVGKMYTKESACKTLRYIQVFFCQIPLGLQEWCQKSSNKQPQIYPGYPFLFKQLNGKSLEVSGFLSFPISSHGDVLL